MDQAISPTSDTSILGSATSRRPICYAHRGARGHAPENTLLAFAIAFDLGAETIECDVQRSRDGELVIIHDGTVSRTTGGTGAVADMRGDELRALNAGQRWHLTARIPTLAETLALVRERGGALNLEIKGESVEQSIGTALAVAPELAALDEDFRPRILVSSFEHPAIQLLKERLPWLRTGALYGSEWRRRDLIAPTLALRAEAIHPGVSLASRELIQRAHDTGLRVNIWTANRPALIRQLLVWGADGIFSDFPERVIIARRLCSAWDGASPADDGDPEEHTEHPMNAHGP